VSISKEYLRKITADRARRERPDFVAPGLIAQANKIALGSPLREVIRTAPEIQELVPEPLSTKVVKLDDGRVSIVEAMNLFGWSMETKFSWQIVKNTLTLLATENGDISPDSSHRILIPVTLRRRINLEKLDQIIVITDSLPVANVQVTPVNQLHKYLRGI
jgi:hypothetical protein